MRTGSEEVYGFMAEFAGPDELLEAAKKAHEAGYTRMDGYSPFEVEGLGDIVGFHRSAVPLIFFVSGFGCAALGFFMCTYASVWSYPLIVGGRPLFSWPSFIPITFECGILGGSVIGICGMLAMCGLPRPYHPVFNCPDFSLATKDRFFLCLEAADPKFHPRDTWQFLSQMQPLAVNEVSNVYRSGSERLRSGGHES